MVRIKSSVLTAFTLIVVTSASGNERPPTVRTPDALPMAEGYYEKKEWLPDKIFLPIIILWGLATKIASVYFLNQHVKRRSVALESIFLTIIAIEDTVVMLGGPFRKWIECTSQSLIQKEQEAPCQLEEDLYLNYFSIHFCLWTLVVLTVEKVSAFLGPQNFRDGDISRRGFLTIFVIFIAIRGWLFLLQNSMPENVKRPSLQRYKDASDLTVGNIFMNFLSLAFPMYFISVVVKHNRKQKNTKTIHMDVESPGRATGSVSKQIASICLIFLPPIAFILMYILYLYKYATQATVNMMGLDYYKHKVLYPQLNLSLLGVTNLFFNGALIFLFGPR